MYSPEATPNGRGKVSNNDSDALPEKKQNVSLFLSGKCKRNNAQKKWAYSVAEEQLKLLSTKRIAACERSGVTSPAASAPHVYTLPISLLAGDNKKFGEFRISSPEAVSCGPFNREQGIFLV